MATVKAANVTKYEAGGGDNVIPDGYIKSVEKVWIDTYAVDAAIPSTTTIAIGMLPKGAKLTDVTVYLPVLTATAVSVTTISCSTDEKHNGATVGTLGLLYIDGLSVSKVSTATQSTVRLGPTAALTQLSATTESTIFIQFNVATSITAGTIRSIIRYT